MVKMMTNQQVIVTISESFEWMVMKSLLMNVNNAHKLRPSSYQRNRISTFITKLDKPFVLASH